MTYKQGRRSEPRAGGKYRNQRTDGFASKREAKRAAELRLLERAGKISELGFQVPFELIPRCGSNRPTTYLADFTYRENGSTVVEDCKGFRTEAYRLKRKLMRWRYGIEIRET